MALENDICSNFENSGNVDVNTKLNGKQACQACFFFGYFSKTRKNLSHRKFYHSNDRSVLVPSSCKFLAIVWGKQETIMLKSANCRLQSLGECLTDAWILQRNCSPIYFPHLSPLPQKKYQPLVITGSQATLSVTGSTPSKVRPVMLLFSSTLPDPLSPRKWKFNEYNESMLTHIELTV